MNTSILHKLTTIVAILLLLVTHTATASYRYKPDKTRFNVQKKAVIIKHDAKLFKNATGYRGKKARFMQVYFMMKPVRRSRIYYRRNSVRANRVPVSKRPYKTGRPDGWLDKNAFVEWNTLQMIKLEPQSGRKLANIFENEHCAELFGKNGRVYSGCQILGSEPNRFISKTNFQLLIPVFEKARKNYQGGFIRVYEKDSTVQAAPASFQTPKSHRQSGHQRGRLGYDILFVVDSTASMGPYFNQTKKVLQTFIKQLQKSVNGKNRPLRVGVLFYRGRKDHIASCNMGYLTKWGHHLTKDVNHVIKALASEKEATCSSKDKQAAVLDGLNRVLNNQHWEDNHFKSIILVGNTQPYPVYARKNPMRLSAYLINKIARKKNIRLITFKLGDEDRTFKRLALDTVAANRGRYYNLPLQKNNTQTFNKNLFKAMTDEWRMLAIAQNMVDDTRRENTPAKRRGATTVDLLNDPTFRRKYNLTQYEALIIRARLPNTTTAQAAKMAPEFVKGWIPQDIQNQSAVGEFIFMDRFSLKKLANTLGSLAEAALIGQQEGGVAFISTVRNVLAAQTRVPTNRLFRSGESLAGTLQKAQILPFRTDILTFTAQEVNTWKPADYRRINTILKEKVKVLGEFMGNPRNIHYFGNTPHLYVPRAFFP